MKNMTNERKRLNDCNMEMRDSKAEMLCMLELYEIDKKHIMTQPSPDWRGYKNDYKHNSSVKITDAMLNYAYSRILRFRKDIGELRLQIGTLCNIDYHEDKSETTRGHAINVLRSITGHDNPVVHFGNRSPFNEHGSYRHYSVNIRASWFRTVFKKGLALQDIAGRSAFVVNAVKLVNTKEDYEAYAATVVTIRRPISSAAQIAMTKQWEAENLDTNMYGTMVVQGYSRNYKHPAFLVYEERYIVRTMSNDGWQTTTGTTVNWAASTLKSRMKKIMLAKLNY